MLTLILDDFEEVQKIINEKSLLTHREQLVLLARYCRNELRYSIKKTEEELWVFLRKSIPFLSEMKWAECVAKAARTGGKFPLISTEAICVTQKELNLIEQLDNLGIKRLTFTLIVMAKYWDWRKGNASGWINCPLGNILKLAGGGISSKDGLIMLHQLYELGYIQIRKGIGNLSLRILCLDNEGSTAIALSDMRAIGMEYLSHCGLGEFIRCNKCGLLIRKGKNRRCCDRCKTPPTNTVRRVVCEECGLPFWVEYARNQKRCGSCAELHRREYSRRYMEGKRKC